MMCAWGWSRPMELRRVENSERCAAYAAIIEVSLRSGLTIVFRMSYAEWDLRLSRSMVLLEASSIGVPGIQQLVSREWSSWRIWLTMRIECFAAALSGEYAIKM